MALSQPLTVIKRLSISVSTAYFVLSLGAMEALARPIKIPPPPPPPPLDPIGILSAIQTVAAMIFG